MRLPSNIRSNFLYLSAPKSRTRSEAPRPPRQDGAGTAGPVDKAHGPEYVEWASRARSGEQNASKGSFVHIVPLPARRQAGTPLIPLRRDGARSGQRCCRVEASTFDDPFFKIWGCVLR
jgi:hypothetical protein